jgi:hemolysin activation/secretion protein
MSKNTFLLYALLVLSPCVFAQQPPFAGGLLRQIPPAPVPQKVEPKVGVEPPVAPAVPDPGAARIIVNKLSVTGSETYSEAELIALTNFSSGSELTLGDLRGMASTIADFYHRHGFFIAQAYLPTQDIKDGVVTIAVIEGHYGKVTLSNQTRLSANLAENLLTGLNEGDRIESAPLENRLLLLSDLPGVNVNSTLVPGTAAGSSDLVVSLTPAPTVSGEVDADNGGNYYTGEYRLGATVKLNNLAGNGDVASLRAVTAGSGLNYARASYQMQFGKVRAGIAYSALEYKIIHGPFAGAGLNGTADVASIFGSYPLMRARNGNLYAGLAYEDRTFRDKQNSTVYSDRDAQVVMASLYGDHRDGFGGRGFNTYSLTWSIGNLDIQTPGLRANDAITAQTNGRYNKLAFTATRLQSVTDQVSLFAGINGQVAAQNLDSSEKMELGGMYGVRAYPEGEAFGDAGYVLTLEARLQLPRLIDQMPGQMQLIGFVDTGTVEANKSVWAAVQGQNVPNRRSLSGAGVGFTWTDPNKFMARAYYAAKLGNEHAISSPDRSGRFWLQLVKYF